MRRNVTAKHRSTLTLYYLATTAEYRIIGNLFGVSASFVCTCVKDMSGYYETVVVNNNRFQEEKTLFMLSKVTSKNTGFQCMGMR